uniref:Membrane protein MLC1 isoform X1 n=2 Tax=Petromyzon marinus TaxID=7757 RepID=A0AAJ7T2Y7_PETMA|nr:membrane protein MLC1 isoform X1 [Petromyzon marinus]
MASCAQTVAATTNIAIGVALWLVSGASVYTGCLGPEDVGYLRCAGAVVRTRVPREDCIPAATVHLYIGSRKTCLVSCFHLLAVSTFTMSTLCLLWYGCMLVARPSMLSINTNLLLLLLLEMLVVVHLLLVVRARQRCCPGAVSRSYNLKSQGAAWDGHVFPVRAVRLCATLEVVGGVFALFGGVMALTLQPWSAHSASLQACLWTLIAGFPAAVAGHVASEHPSMPLVEVLLALSGLTSPVTAAAAGYLCVSLPRSIALFTEPDSSMKVIDILMVAIMVALLINSALTLVTTFVCVNYKTLALLPLLPTHSPCTPASDSTALNNYDHADPASRVAPPYAAPSDPPERGRAQPPPGSPQRRQRHLHRDCPGGRPPSPDRPQGGGRAGSSDGGPNSLPSDPLVRHGLSDSPGPARARPSPGQSRRVEHRRSPVQHRPPAAPATPDRGRALYVTVGSQSQPLSSLSHKPPPPRKASSSELVPATQGPQAKRGSPSQTPASGNGKASPPPKGFKPPVFSVLASPGGRGKHSLLVASAKPVALLPLPPPRDVHGDARAAPSKETRIKRLREKFVDNI